ncbi:unnamed protein product [Urochloa humidicola]
MPPAVAPDPPRQNPSGPELAAATMANPGLGLGLAPPGAEPTTGAPPPSRRAPRLAKRRHAPRSHSRRPPRGRGTRLAAAAVRMSRGRMGLAGLGVGMEVA